jgi:ankyrin repeat protein
MPVTTGSSIHRLVSRLALVAPLLTLCAPGNAASEADLKWDLSYRSALASLPDNEFLAPWIAQFPNRPIHQKLAAYSGDPIQASLLIERPDGHAGYVFAIWFIRTRSDAKVCSFHPKHMDDPCITLDPARTETFIRKVMSWKPLPPQKAYQNEIGDGPHGKIVANYSGFLSAYLDGAALQRVINNIEMPAGMTESEAVPNEDTSRLSRAMMELMLSPEEFAKQLAQLDLGTLLLRFKSAVKKGDANQVRAMLERESGLDGKTKRIDPSNYLSTAAGNGDVGMVSLLLAHGANIDANGSAPLAAAVEANKEQMVEYLLSKGAKADPPKDKRGIVSERSPLRIAVEKRNEKMARLLIKRGADVNLPQFSTVLDAAVQNADLALVDLVLKAGANPDGAGTYHIGTPLLWLMSQGGRSGRPQDNQNAMSEQDTFLAPIVRRLVTAGADVNHITSTCNTAFNEASLQHREAMTTLLLELGADPALHRRCNDANGRSVRGAEMDARDVVTSETTRYLKAGDYRSLEELYLKVKDGQPRTPSGIWTLAVFYHALSAYGHLEQADAWIKAYPTSVAARILQASLYQRRAQSDCRCNGSKESAAATQALKILAETKAMAAQAKDPEWYRAMIETLPYSSSFADLPATLNEGAAAYPAYHEMYFSAAWYSHPNWHGSFDRVETIARTAARSSATPEARALYARIYWYLNQARYDGELFKQSRADWPTMRASFNEIVAAYPDAYNFNAFAYFACLAHDDKTARGVMQRAGDQLVLGAWGKGGAQLFARCFRQ